MYAAALHPVANAASPCAASGSRSSAGRCDLTRGFAATSKLRPKHRGGKIKTSGGYKERFKLTATGESSTPPPHHALCVLLRQHATVTAYSVTWQLQMYVQSVGHVVPRTAGFKEYRSLLRAGKIRHMRTGHRHKRWAKTSDQNRKLRRGRNLFETYAITLKKLGFTRRTF